MIHKAKHLPIVLVCLALVVSVLSCDLQESAQGPGSQKRLELQLEKAPRLNEPVELRCISKVPWYVPNEKINVDFTRVDPKTGWEVDVPLEDMLVEGDFNWEAAVTKDVLTEFSAIIKFPEEGNWEVCAVSTSPGWEYDCIRLHVTEDSGMFGYQEDHSPRPSKGLFPVIPSERWPMTVELDISEAPRLDEPAELTWSISSIRDLYAVFARIEFYHYDGTSKEKYLSEDILLDGDVMWGGSLKKDTPVQLSATITLPQEGDWEIHASGLCYEGVDFTPINAGVRIYLHVGKEKSRFGWVESHEKEPTTPRPPLPLPPKYEHFRVELDLEETPRLNEPVRLTCTLKSPEDITADARVKFRGPKIEGELPLQEILVEGDLSWEGVVTEDIPVQFSAIIKFPLPGNWEVRLSAEGDRKGGTKTISIPDEISVHIPGVVLNIDAPDMVAAGSNFTAGVKITEVTNFDSYQLDVIYDPTVIEIIGVEGSAAGVTPGLINSTSIPIDMWEFSPPGEPGTIRVTGNVPGDAGVTGSGCLAEVHFHAISSSGNRDYIGISTGISSGQLLDNTGAEITPVVIWPEDYYVHVSPPVPVRAVSIDSPREVATDSEFVVRVNVTEVTNLDAYQVDLTYDSAVIEVSDVTEGRIGSIIIPIDMWGFFPPETPGMIRLLGNIPGVAGVTGSGYLAEIHFRVIGSHGSTSDMTLSNGMLGDNGAQEIPVTEWLGDSAQVAAE